MSTSTPPVNPATHCPGCGGEIDDVRARFCAACGRQLMRPDLRAHHVVAASAPPVAARQPEPPPDLAAAPPPPLVAWPPPVAGPAPAGPSHSAHGLAGALGSVVVLALLALSAIVILAVARHDPPTPNVSQGPVTVTTAAAP